MFSVLVYSVLNQFEKIVYKNLCFSYKKVCRYEKYYYLCAVLEYQLIKNISDMKNVKSAKVSMFIFIAHGSLKKIEYINYDYIGQFAMLINIVLLVGTLFFNFANNESLVFSMFATSLLLLPLFALIEKLIQSILKSFYK